MRFSENIPLVSPETLFIDALQVMTKKGLGICLILEGEKLIGVLTDGDIRRALTSISEPLPSLFCRDVVSKASTEPFAYRLERIEDLSEHARDIAEMMKRRSITVIPIFVSNQNQYVVVESLDLINCS